MLYETQGTEAIRAMMTLRQCWLNNEEVYLNRGCLHCGSAATYLIYFTNRQIQDLMLNFIAQYPCQGNSRFDLLDLAHFAHTYDEFLTALENLVIHYSFSRSLSVRTHKFEQIESIFERAAAIAC